ncbi:hypothetical protein BLNAU_24566 [Blattamonas nauphoetae]|uniref:Uncharacterized protein n=1 Tax=Blattamonas nauphoetae TaxID=2049346 RepID=A0ABQ9WMI1_9EUKA|nr:hypothetical protein BLNAU_24566 [Blattamonas nauphoetae]
MIMVTASQPPMKHGPHNRPLHEPAPNIEENQDEEKSFWEAGDITLLTVASTGMIEKEGTPQQSPASLSPPRPGATSFAHVPFICTSEHQTNEPPIQQQPVHLSDESDEMMKDEELRPTDTTQRKQNSSTSLTPGSEWTTRCLVQLARKLDNTNLKRTITLVQNGRTRSIEQVHTSLATSYKSKQIVSILNSTVPILLDAIEQEVNIPLPPSLQ